MKITIPLGSISQADIDKINVKFSTTSEQVSDRLLSISDNTLYTFTGESTKVENVLNFFLNAMSVSERKFEYTRNIKDTIFVFWEKIAEDNNLPWYQTYLETGKRQTIVYDLNVMI